MRRSVWSDALRAVLLLAVGAAPLAAQSDEELIADRCGGAAICLRHAQAAVMLAPALGLGFAGANPVPGTPSTLGMRLGSLPRLSAALRANVVTLETPRAGGTEAERRTFGALSGDASVGLFAGFSPAPTVGGVGAVDLLVSVGVLPFGGGFDDTAVGWGAGVRLGVLRESFTMPGVSLSAMYRAVTETGFEDETAGTQGLVDARALSLRATAGKQLFSIELTGTLGYDRYTSNVGFDGTGIEDYTTDLVSAAGSASLTFVVFTAMLEAGWQQGVELLPGLTAADAGVDGDGTLFGSVALRLSI